jgi:hypothetical protein
MIKLYNLQTYITKVLNLIQNKGFKLMSHFTLIDLNMACTSTLNKSVLHVNMRNLNNSNFSIERKIISLIIQS